MNRDVSSVIGDNMNKHRQLMRIVGVSLAALVLSHTGYAAEIPLPDLRLLLPGLKGVDNRDRVDVSEFPWRAIGRVNRATGGFCTGVLVGPRTVLTAAHCLWNKQTRRLLPPISLHFLAGYNKEKYLVHGRVVGVWAPKPFLREKMKGGNLLSKDYALLTLARPVGNMVGYLTPFPKGKDERRVTQAGYSQDLAQVLSRDVGCEITGYERPDKGVLQHSCDAVGGDSGSPLIVWEENTPYILAIHVATRRSSAGGDSLGIAVRVPGQVFETSARN